MQANPCKDACDQGLIDDQIVGVFDAKHSKVSDHKDSKLQQHKHTTLCNFLIVYLWGRHFRQSNINQIYHAELQVCKDLVRYDSIQFNLFI